MRGRVISGMPRPEHLIRLNVEVTVENRPKTELMGCAWNAALGRLGQEEEGYLDNTASSRQGSVHQDPDSTLTGK